MKDSEGVADAGEQSRTERRSGYRPEQPIKMGPLFQWPLRPAALFKWLFGFPGFLWPYPAFFVALALLSWLFLTPDMGRMESFSADWIAALLARNLLLLVAFVSMWHVWLYVRREQGTEYKYDNRWLSVDNPTFLFRNQLWDNILWNVCSAVPIWTAYEAVTLWLHANGLVPTVTWQSHPVYCVFLILLTGMWHSVHFYATHRLIHWPPLFRSVHYLHHKNINIGPWSGMAMHPIEHLIYFSAVMLFWVIPSHPLHSVYALLFYALGPSIGHLGFDRVVLGRNSALMAGDYMHYLHHKYVTVNYGNGGVPLDKWLRTFHDGSDEATEALHRRARARALHLRGRRDKTL
jgi:sterol desaturase/sphingolipid hydroxylase (fatty acid hydroxylase superfamily)